MAADEKPVPTPQLTFGEFRLDCNLKRLYRGTEAVKLAPKPFGTLEFLISNRERVVSKDELLSSVWREQRDQNTVDQAVGKLRKVLGDAVAQPQYIETIPGQGYHFIAPVLTHSILAGKDTAFETSAPDIRGTANADRVPMATSARIHWRAILIILGSLSVLSVAALFVFRVARVPNPKQATVAGAELTALDGTGHPMWRYQFPRPLLAVAQEPSDLAQHLRMHVEDLNGDGKNEILVPASYGNTSEASDELYCFAPSSRLLWRYQPHADFTFVGRKASGPWKLRAMTVVPDTGNTKAVWAAFSDPVFAPTLVASVDAAGLAKIRYVSSGTVYAMINVVSPTGTFMLAGGINNEYRAASLAVLDTRQPPAVSPQTQGNRFQCTNCPTGHPLLYLVLPRSEVNVGSGQPYNWVNSFERHGGGILVSALEQRDEELGTEVRQYFELSDDLIPRNISFGAAYREAHERLEKRGLIAHKWSDCQEQKHPAIARVWNTAQGWREVQIPWVH